MAVAIYFSKIQSEKVFTVHTSFNAMQSALFFPFPSKTIFVCTFIHCFEIYCTYNLYVCVYLNRRRRACNVVFNSSRNDDRHTVDAYILTYWGTKYDRNVLYLYNACHSIVIVYTIV